MKVWKELHAKLPRYAEDARFGSQPSDVNDATLGEIIASVLA